MTFSSSSAQCLPGHTATINMSYHAPRRADQPLPCTTNTASYAHSPIPYHDPSIKYAPARRPHDFMATQHTPRLCPIPNSLHQPLCPCRSNFELVFGMTTSFLECIALMGLNFWFSWERNLGSATIAMRYTLHGPTTLYSPPNPFVDPCFLCYNIVVLCRLPESRWHRPRYHRDGMARVVVGLSVVVIFYNPLTIIFYWL